MARRAAADARLIPVQKQVEREGKSHTQTYWVRAAEVGASVKDAMAELKPKLKAQSLWTAKDPGTGKTDSGVHVYDGHMEKWYGIVGELGGDGKAADRWMNGWSTASTDPSAQVMRGAALRLAAGSEDEFRAMLEEETRDVERAALGGKSREEKIAEIEEERRRQERTFGGPPTAPPAADLVDEHLGHWKTKDPATALRTVRERLEMGARQGNTMAAMAAMSQAMHPEPEVELFRGVHGAQADAIHAAIGRARERGETHVEIDVGVIGSFSELRTQVSKFAKGKVTGRDGIRGAIIRVAAPRESILLSHKALPQIDNSQVKGKNEVAILTRGPLKVRIEDIEVIDPTRVTSRWMR